MSTLAAVVTPTSGVDGGKSSLQKLKHVCDSVRAILSSLHDQRKRAKAEGTPLDKSQFKQQRWQVLVLLSAMKAGLRDTFLEADEWKKRVQEQKDVVEAHQLKLQNLLYEKDHLLREIRRCRGFRYACCELHYMACVGTKCVCVASILEPARRRWIRSSLKMGSCRFPWTRRSTASIWTN